MDHKYADNFYESTLASTVSRHSVERALDAAAAAVDCTAPAAATGAKSPAIAHWRSDSLPPAISHWRDDSDSVINRWRSDYVHPVIARWRDDSGSVLNRWRSDLGRDFLACLGGMPWQCPLNIQRGEPKRLIANALSEVGYKGDTSARNYTRERLVFETEPGLLTPAYLLVPEGANAETPTVIALHGHGFGVADIVGLRPDGSEQAPGESGYHKAFAVALAQRGFVVIAPELFGFGELRLTRDIKPDNPYDSSCNAVSSMLFMVGRTTAGVRVNQASRCIDALTELGYAHAPVAMGISGGGLVCAYFAALDERVSACCVSGFANTYRGCFLAMHHCIDCFQPNLLLTADMPDILAMIAPRPMIWESGELDPIFPIAQVMEAEQIVRRMYNAYGRGDDFALDRFPLDHQIHGVVSYDFLWEHANNPGRP